MKIKTINIDKYGKFKDKTSITLDKGLNVVVGKNEAGKSTLRHAFGELLYGFQSSKEEKHPYSSGSEMVLTGDIEFHEESEVSLQRVLSRKAEGTLIMGGHTRNIGNSVLERLREIPYILYKGLFELDLSDLVALDPYKWKEVEAQISLQYGLSNIFTPQHVLSELEKEMHQLWRPHNRGRYKVKEIDEKLHELSERLTSLKRQRLSMEDKLSKKVQIEGQITELTSKIEETSNWIDHGVLQLDAFKALSEIREIEMELATYNFETLDIDTYKVLVHEIEKLKGEKTEIEKALSSIQSQKHTYSKLEKDLQLFSKNNQSADDQSIYEQINAYKNALNAYNEQKESINQTKRILESRSKELTGDPWNDALMAYWVNLDIGGLEKQVDRRKLLSVSNIGLWIIGLLGASLVAGGYYFDMSNIIYAGGGLLAMGLLPMLGSLNRSPLDYGEIRFRDKVWLKKEVFINACEKIADQSSLLVQDLEDYEAHRQAYKEKKKDLDEVIKTLSLETPGSSDEVIEQVLQVRMNLSKKVEEDKILDASASVYLSQKRKVGHALLMNQQKLAAFKNDLRKYGATPEEGMAMLERLGLLKQRRDMLVEDLKNFDKEHPQALAYRENKDFDKALTQKRQDLEDLRQERETLKIDLMALQKDEERVFEDVRLETIESEISKQKWEREQVIQNYNKLRMVHTMIKFADEKFRSKYQPDLLKQASNHLSRFTNGRYNQLAASENGDLQVQDTHQDLYIPVHKQLSRGTLEQIYLALRIAVAQTIDSNHSQAPLILDEIFVNWDQDRLEGALDVLAELSDSRQILYFTCHEWMADKLEAKGAHKVFI